MKRLSLLVAVLFLLSGTSDAQWVHLNGPYGSQVNCFTVSGSNLLVGTEDGGIFLSPDSGTSWRSVNVGLTSLDVRSLTVHGADIFAGTSGGRILRSTDQGASWSVVITDLSGWDVQSLASNGGEIFAGTTGGGIFRSPDNGATWESVNSGLGNLNVSSFAFNGGSVFAGTRSGVFTSTNKGADWIRADSSLALNTVVWALAMHGSALVAGTHLGVYISSDNGIHWVSSDNGIPIGFITSITTSGLNLYGGTWGAGVYRSTNDGETWSYIGLRGIGITSLVTMGQKLFVGTSNDGVYFTANNGSTWVRVAPRTMDIQTFGILGPILFAGSSSGGVLRSTDFGTTWTGANTGIRAVDVRAFASKGRKLFAGARGGVFLSVDTGTSWSTVNNGLTNHNVKALAIIGDNVFAGTGGSGVFLSSDDGTSWVPVNSGLTNLDISSLVVSGTKLFARSMEAGIFHSTNNGLSWTSVNSGLPSVGLRSLAVSGSCLLAGTIPPGLYRSTDYGLSWAPTGITEYVSVFAVKGNVVFAGAGSGVLVSTDDGDSWEQTGLSLSTVYSMTTCRGYVVAGTYGGGVWRRPISQMAKLHILISVDDIPADQGGKVSLFWSASHLDTNTTTLPYYSIWRSIAQVPEAATNTQPAPSITLDFKGPAFRTTMIDGKEYAWEWIANQPAHRFSEYSYTAPTLFDNGMHYFLVSAHTNDPNVFYDSNVDGGYSVDNLSPSPPQNFTGNHVGNTFVLHWDANSEPDIDHYEIYRSGYPGFNPDTMTSLATVEGTTFADIMMLPIPTYYYVVRAVDIHGNLSVKSAEVSTVLVGVEETEALPTEYSLGPNYPNPFNPLTTIRYGLPNAEMVRLTVYNMLGQEVRVLVDERQEAGYKTVSFDASNLPSSVYTYRITAGSFSEVKKMLLIK